VSDVFVTRDKYSCEEVRELFYTHEEALQFSVDYSREAHRADAAGMTWYDWWESREDAGLQQQQEQEQEAGTLDDGGKFKFKLQGQGQGGGGMQWSESEGESESVEEYLSTGEVEEDGSNDFNSF
jgi:hypothetical protein